MASSDNPPPLPALQRFSPLIPIVLGMGCLVGLSLFITAPVHIAGDGSLKQFLLDSWIRTGRITSEISWPETEPWVGGLWREFHFPFESPFLYEGQAVFPPFFLLLSLPLYQALGYGGLFVLPALSLAGLWAIVGWILNRMEVRGAPAALALAMLVLSPLTYFGMMFWEHAPGLCALFGGFAMLVRRGEKPAGDIAAGFLLALAVMLRPELVVAAGVIFGFSLLRRPRRAGAIPGVAAGLLAWTAVNAWVTGHPAGIHARQPLYLSGGETVARLLTYYSELGTMMTASAAGAVGGLVLGVFFLRREDDAEARGIVLTLLLAAGASLLILPWMIPYSGEYMGFRRFELLILPAGALAAGRLAGRYRWALIVLSALCLLQAPRFVRQFEIFRWAQGPRLVPVLEAIESASPAAIIGDSQFTVIELSSRLKQTPLLWAPPPSELTRLVDEVADQTGLERIALVFWKPGASTTLTIPVRDRGPVQWVRVAGDDEGFAMFMPQ